MLALFAGGLHNKDGARKMAGTNPQGHGLTCHCRDKAAPDPRVGEAVDSLERATQWLLAQKSFYAAIAVLREIAHGRPL